MSATRIQIPRRMRILVVGSGGREHALCAKFVAHGHEVFAAPGREGLWQGVKCVPLKATDIPGITNWCRANKPDLVVVGPERPLVGGLADRIRELGIPVFGPSARAATASEGSKAAAKVAMEKVGIRTAAFKVFSCDPNSGHKGNYDDAVAYIRAHGAPIVLKADGLCEGKGVYVCKTIADALEKLRWLMKDKIFGDAGTTVVIENFVPGQELSVMAVTDGKRCLVFPSSRDHKLAHDGDTGKNTGGMGAVAPAPGVKEEMMTEAKEKIIIPFLEYLATQGAPFVGCIYVGLKITPEGLVVLEFNCRFGDPEIQAVLRLLKPEIDLAVLLHMCAVGALNSVLEAVQEHMWLPSCAICVVLATKGYPDQKEEDYGKVITGVEGAKELSGVQILDAGTKQNEKKERVNAGGRVLNVTAVGKDVGDARKNVYQAVKTIRFEGVEFRTDIGVAVAA